jgi:DNA-binding CsgD family transcriptional regulator
VAEYAALFNRDGQLEFATPAMYARLASGLLPELARLVHAHARGHTAASSAKFTLDIVLLTRAHESRYLVFVHPRENFNLSPRQREIAEYAAAGATAREIAATLGISPHTVRQHLKDVYRTLGVSSRVELVRAIS